MLYNSSMSEFYGYNPLFHDDYISDQINAASTLGLDSTARLQLAKHLENIKARSEIFKFLQDCSVFIPDSETKIVTFSVPESIIITLEKVTEKTATANDTSQNSCQKKSRLTISYSDISFKFCIIVPNSKKVELSKLIGFDTRDGDRIQLFLSVIRDILYPQGEMNKIPKPQMVYGLVSKHSTKILHLNPTCDELQAVS